MEVVSYLRNHTKNYDQIEKKVQEELEKSKPIPVDK